MQMMYLDRRWDNERGIRGGATHRLKTTILYTYIKMGYKGELKGIDAIIQGENDQSWRERGHNGV